MQRAPLPEQAPPHPEKMAKGDPPDTLAVRITGVPSGKAAWHVPGQSMPAGLLTTVPPLETFPVVFVFTVSESVGFPTNVPLIWVSELSVTVQLVWVPEQAPLHPLKLSPDPAAAVNVICEPGANGALQVDPQFMPEGLLVIVPAPDVLTVSTGQAENVAVTDSALFSVIAHVVLP